MIPKSIVVFRVAVEGTTKSSTRYQIHIKLSYMADIIRRIPDIVSWYLVHYKASVILQMYCYPFHADRPTQQYI